ncbi:hypothetical protein [Acidithiobacillus sulfuriphilus]|uniref:Uncharacterized protein n=2 Tax=Acidithiobacillus sulfuriphilus TaxID=1867749 RepID=A0A3M8QUN5_9PROT|nr:hypothetical protein [Acidithiobacillus sulfuriphilus]RNF58704.1 hypothetical protein EC580_12700 [Acidithiobacillus sulfuriphilus]
MAATAHSDPYAIFMRKIGYSVGLESTLERMGDLEAMYTKNRDITLSSWNELVSGSEHWNLKSDNIADVFYSLRLIQRIPGDILVLENLDAMAIASALLEDAPQRDVARAFLMLWAVLVNDGEIFVNLLLAGFEEQQIKERLSAMIQQKRAALSAVLSGRDSIKRINRTINVERQEKNKGSAGAGQSVVSLKRTTPLQAEKTRGVDATESDEIEFSEDYFRKVPPRRKDWARSLGLWEDKSGLTQRGKEFIDRLTEAGYIDAKGLFIYWPMDYELVRAGFRPDLLGEHTKSLWDCLVDFGGAYAHLRVKPISSSDADDAVELIYAMMEVVQSHHVRKAMLRREIPIAVAYAAAVAYACATQKPILDLPAAIAAEQEGEKRRLALRRSRNTGAALSLKR